MNEGDADYTLVGIYRQKNMVYLNLPLYSLRYPIKLASQFIRYIKLDVSSLTILSTAIEDSQMLINPFRDSIIDFL